MVRTKWMYNVCAVLAAVGVFGQASSALATGCLKSDGWDDTLGNAQELECNDGSAAGSAQLLSIGATTKRYFLAVALLSDPSPDESFATLRLQNAAGQTFPAVQDQAADGIPSEQNQDITINQEMVTIELEAGDATGN